MIKVVTDSGADITPREAQEMDIEVVPLKINFPDHPYDQEADEDYDTFYKLLKSEDTFPKTSQPPPEAFARVFEAAKKAGDTVIAVLISGGLSGTVQSAQIAKETVGHEDVHIIDSRTAIMSQRTLVEYAVRLRNAGEGVRDVIRKVEAICQRVRVFGMLDTLTYLYKGGRLSRTAAMAGNLLHIKPLITIKDGAIATSGRGRNFKAIIKQLDEIGFDPDFPVYFGFTADDTNCRKMMDQALANHTIPHTGIFPIGGVIGAHVGPGGMAISFVPKG